MLKEFATERAVSVALAAAALIAAAIAVMPARPAGPPGLAARLRTAEVPLAQAYGP
jgi:hypothetical protein